MPTTPPESGVAPTRIAKASAISCQRSPSGWDSDSDSASVGRAIARQLLDFRGREQGLERAEVRDRLADDRR
jgi:hypothetical protein